MKRYVYVPAALVGADGAPPEDAKQLASKSHLSIMTGTDEDGFMHDSITIVSVPYEKWMNCDSEAKCNFAHTVTAVDEFGSFSESYVLTAETPDGDLITTEPTLCEKHKLFFVSRYQVSGDYKYSIINTSNGYEYAVGTFRVT